jgi:hypothetical protein
LPVEHDTGAVSDSVFVWVVVVDPSGFVVVVVVVVLVPVVCCVAVFVCVVPGGGVALGFTTKSVGWTLVAGTTEVARPVSGTGFETVESDGVGVACAPTDTVLDSMERGLFAGNPPT